MTLDEAASVFWPHVTTATLQREISVGRLIPQIVAGHTFVTPRLVAARLRRVGGGRAYIRRRPPP